jgi:hypothetical protein
MREKPSGSGNAPYTSALRHTENCRDVVDALNPGWIRSY